MNKRAVPEKFLLYKHALALYKLMNTDAYSLEWSAPNYNSIFTSRQTHLVSQRENLKREGLNALANRTYFVLIYLDILYGTLPHINALLAS